MGCDIHGYIDTEYNSGNRYVSNFAKLSISRDYLLFGLLTNGCVRDPDTEGFVSDPKGLPPKISSSVLDEASHLIIDDSKKLEIRDRNINICTYSNAKEWHESWRKSPYVRKKGNDELEYLEGDLPPKTANKYFYDYRILCPDRHSFSWLALEDLERVRSAYKLKLAERLEKDEFERKWYTKHDIPLNNSDLEGIIGAMQGLNKSNLISRFVFWFDN